jgi:lysozyme
MMDRASQLVAEEEGPFILKAYKDTLGVWTCGRGHKLPDQSQDHSALEWTQEHCQAQFEEDIDAARERAANLPGFQRCSPIRQAVLVSMCYQLGTLASWPHFKAAVAMGDFDAAADAGLDSQWALQTPKRARRQMTMLRTDQWVEHV